MWIVLYYVTPATISFALLLLFAFSLLIASIASKRQGPPLRHMWKFLAAVTSVYIVILTMPPSGDLQTSTSRIVFWNPLHFMDEIAAEGNVEESYVQHLTDGNVARYAPEELSEQEREAARQINPIDFFVHDDSEGGIAVVDKDGNPVTLAQEQLVVSEISEGIEMVGEPIQYQTMILEEKTLNALLFVPLGILVYFSFSSWWVRVFFGPVTSVSIEVIQWITAAGNTSDTADVLANSLGHFVGVGMAAASMALLSLRMKASRSLLR